jgi:spore coat polysaccharide biosynthesis protein SpsF (cytidylyltransferase family)/ribosomal protein S18 acetylase RimI-like enzyme
MPFHLEQLEFETSIFGAPVAQLVMDDVRNFSALQDNEYWLISSRVPVDAIDQVECLVSEGFREIESLVTYRRPTVAVQDGSKPQLATNQDFDACLEIGRTSFQFDRFHSDPGVPNIAADKLKESWVKNSLNGRADAVFVTREGDRVTGFNLCRLAGREVTIDLIAVANDMKGHGLGKQLIEKALNHYAGQADFIRAGTQINNVASNRLYLGTGFTEFSQQKTLHWINPVNRPSANPLTIGTVIFARMDSKRLPGKALTQIDGRPLLGRVLDQLRNTSVSNPLIVATSDRTLDDPIAAFAENEGFDVYRGSDSDVLGRAADCARHFRLDAIVRISGDSPFIDGDLIETMVEQHKNFVPDITTNVFPRSLPPGMSIEVISVSALQKMQWMTDSSEDREHVTKYIYGHPDEFQVRSVTFDKGNYDNIHLAVDTPRDLDRAIWIAENSTKLSLDRVTELALQWDTAHPV